MRPYLIVDCYVNDPDGASAFGHQLQGQSWQAIRACEQDVAVDVRKYQGVIITGSAASVLHPPVWLPALFGLVQQTAAAEVPLLGVCFGHQVVAAALGGQVRLAKQPEVGWVELRKVDDDALLRDVGDPFRCFVSHEDEVYQLPSMLRRTVSSKDCLIHGFCGREKPIWGLQFHPEMSLEEATSLVHWRAARHPEHKLEPAQVLLQACSTTELAVAVFTNFVALSLDAGD